MTFTPKSQRTNHCKGTSSACSSLYDSSSQIKPVFSLYCVDVVYIGPSTKNLQNHQPLSFRTKGQKYLIQVSSSTSRLVCTGRFLLSQLQFACHNGDGSTVAAHDSSLAYTRAGLSMQQSQNGKNVQRTSYEETKPATPTFPSLRRPATRLPFSKTINEVLI